MSEVIAKKKERDSNMELLRIVAMILVLTIHVTLGPPRGVFVADLTHSPFSIAAAGHYFFSALSCVCVNVFVLLSGWFGIHYKNVRALEFVFQVVFFGVLDYCILMLTGHGYHLGLRGTFSILIMSNYWFARAYIILYILAPLLNRFTENAERKEFKRLLILFFVIQCLYGWISNGTDWYEKGFSPLSFIGLYLFARYVRIYRPKWSTLSCLTDLSIYACITVFVASVEFVCYAFHLPYLKLEYYSSPTTIVGAMFLLLCFSKFSFKSSFINWIAISCFAVYLFHCDGHFAGVYYYGLLNQWYTNDTLYLAITKSVGLVAFFFIAAIFIDKVRIMIWKECLHIYNSLI